MIDLPRVSSLVGGVSGRAQAATTHARRVAGKLQEAARTGSARRHAGATRTARRREGACRNVQVGSGKGAVRRTPARGAGVASLEGRRSRRARTSDGPTCQARQRRRCRPGRGAWRLARTTRHPGRRSSEKYASWTHCQRPHRTRQRASCASCCGASMPVQLAVWSLASNGSRATFAGRTGTSDGRPGGRDFDG